MIKFNMIHVEITDSKEKVAHLLVDMNKETIRVDQLDDAEVIISFQDLQTLTTLIYRFQTDKNYLNQASVSPLARAEGFR